MVSSLQLPFYRSPFGSPAGRFEQRLASLRCSLSCRCTRCASSLPPEARGSLSFFERRLFSIGWRPWVNEKQTTFNKEKTPWQYDTATQFQPHREKPIQPRTPRKTTPARRGPNSLAKSLDLTSELQTKRIASYVR